MLMRLGINAVAAAMIVPLWTAANSCLMGPAPHGGIVVPPESLLLSVILFGAWSLGDLVVWLKEKWS